MSKDRGVCKVRVCAENKNEVAWQHETCKTEEVAGAGQREPCVQILLSTGHPAEC